MKKRVIIRFLEFFVVGLVLGIGEDLIVIWLSTDATITWDIVAIAFFVALPFAVFSELIVDKPKFWHKIFRLKSEEND